MTSSDSPPDITPSGQAISWRAGLLSIVIHVAVVIVLLLSPRLFAHHPAEDRAGARLAAIDPQRPPQDTLFAVKPQPAPDASSEKIDVSLLEPEQFQQTPGGALALSAWEAIELTGNHLWQSTLCLAVAALLTLALKRNRARVRHAIWVAASVKFLIPFAPLMALGRLFGGRTPVTAVQPAMSVLMDTMSQPFSRPTAVATAALPAASSYDVAALLPFLLLAIWSGGCVVILLTWHRNWRRLTNIVRHASSIRQGHELDTLRRLEARAGIRIPTALVSSDTSLEPGVFGLTNPVLLWPRGIAERLTAGHIEALLAHEVCHIRRRDNLIATVHMIVEALFWIHPLVWWLETRLIDERERACDEDVVRWGHKPVVYAEGILKTCEFYAESPLRGVAGVTGADLKKRIEAIMRNQDGTALSGWRKLLLASAGIATVAVPIVIGTLGAPRLRAQSPAITSGVPVFEAASVKPNRSGEPGWRLDPQPGGRVTATNATAAALIRFAYELPEFQISGGPDWVNSDRFDVVAKAEGNPPVAQTRLMLRRLLAERFNLTAHTETRDLPIYALVMARSDGRIGPRLRRTEADCSRGEPPATDVSGFGPAPSNGPVRCGYFGFAPGTDLPSGKGGLGFRGLTMAALAKTLVPMVRRSVSDQTRLAGYFDADFDFMAELPPPPPPPGRPNPWNSELVSLFTVLPEQLGLKLDSRRGPVEVLVIDRVTQPSPD